MESIFLALNALFLVAIFASAVSWFRLLRERWGQSPRQMVESLLPARERQRPFWSPVDALVMLGAMILITQLLALWMISNGWMQKPPVSGEEAEPLTATGVLAATASSSIGGIGSVVIALVWLRFFDRNARRKLGLTFSSSDCYTGLKASLMILPPVLLINVAVVQFVPYEHEVLESMIAISTPGVFAATFLGTAIITPVVEEFLLRGLLQGGFQGMADRDIGGDDGWRPRAFWPIVVASVIFALLHSGQGAAPIPLFFLSLGLGYLYRQTGSLAPPIVVHMLLNSMTLVVAMVKQNMPLPGT